VDIRTWFNEDLESAVNIVPGVVVIVMAVIGAFLTSLTIAREWERGTMEQLISTPVTPLEVMMGKLAPYFMIGMLDTALCVGMPSGGSRCRSVGDGASFSQLQPVPGGRPVAGLCHFSGRQIATHRQPGGLLATFLPTFLLSGFIYPIDQMPALIRLMTHLIPARFFMTITRDVF